MCEQRQVALGTVDPRVGRKAERRPQPVGELGVEPDAGRGCGAHVELFGAGEQPSRHRHDVQAPRVDAVADLVVGRARSSRERDERPPFVGVFGTGFDAERSQVLASSHRLHCHEGDRTSAP